MQCNIWPNLQWWENKGYNIESDTGGNYFSKVINENFDITVCHFPDITLPSSSQDITITIYLFDEPRTSLVFSSDANNAQQILDIVLTSLEQRIME